MRVLQLTWNDITHKSSPSVIDLLETHPELGILSTGVKWRDALCKNESSNSKDDSDDDSRDDNNDNNRDDVCVLNLLDANLAGRVLLRQPEFARPLPLAAWSIVLSRIKFVSQEDFLRRYFYEEIPFNRENGMYFLMRHGPVLFESRQLGDDG